MTTPSGQRADAALAGEPLYRLYNRISALKLGFICKGRLSNENRLELDDKQNRGTGLRGNRTS